MNPEEMAKLFAQAWSDEEIYSPKRTFSPLKKKAYAIYPLTQLDTFITALKKLACSTDSESDDENAHSMRFVVTADKQILFAREGVVSASIPRHEEIRGKCLAAGKIVFSQDYKSIIKVNHCSGGFCPKFSSLVWPLAILAQMRAPLADTVEVEEWGVVKSKFQAVRSQKMTIGDIQKLVPQLSKPMISINNSQEIEYIRTRHSTTPPIKARLMSRCDALLANHGSRSSSATDSPTSPSPSSTSTPDAASPVSDNSGELIYAASYPLSPPTRLRKFSPLKRSSPLKSYAPVRTNTGLNLFAALLSISIQF